MYNVTSTNTTGKQSIGTLYFVGFLFSFVV